jgi:hypothetical protein
VDHRQKVLMEKERKERERRESYQKEVQQLHKENIKTRELASEKQKAMYKVSEPVPSSKPEKQLSISEDKRMEEEDDADYQEDESMENIFRIDELEEEEEEDVELLKSYISNQLKQKTIKITELSKELDPIR